MPESMKEKLAQIIAEGRVGYMGGAPEERDFATVDAILAALSEPSEAMVLAGQTRPTPDIGWDIPTGESVIFRWQAMLAKAGEE